MNKKEVLISWLWHLFLQILQYYCFMLHLCTTNNLFLYSYKINYNYQLYKNVRKYKFTLWYIFSSFFGGSHILLCGYNSAIIYSPSNTVLMDGVLQAKKHLLYFVSSRERP